MNRSGRFYRIDQLLTARKVVTRQELLDELEISWATLKRDLAFLKDRFNAPIIHDRDAGGYRFAEPGVGPSYELPGLWFSEQEVYALITMQQLLENVGQGSLIGPHIEPFRARLDAMLGEGDSSAKDIRKRIKLIAMASRKQSPVHFSEVGAALFKRKRIEVRYHSRAKDEVTQRELSPQRLVHYRDNWYLDAWCHLRNDLRGFSLDGMQSVRLLPAKALDVPIKSLDQFLASSYGIFAGGTPREAELVTRELGLATARQMLLEAAVLDAPTLLARGFLHAVLPDTEVATEVAQRAARMTRLSPQAARLNKQALRALAHGQPAETLVATAYDYADSAEHREGIAAFLAKRPPVF